MNELEAIHYPETRLAAKISMLTIELIEQYAPEYFDDPRSERFSIRLQSEINKKTTAFLANLGVDHLSVENLPAAPE